MDFKFSFNGEETDYDNMLIIEGNTDDIESVTLEMFDPEVNTISAVFYLKNTNNLDRLIDALQFVRNQVLFTSINAYDSDSSDISYPPSP